MSTSAATTRTSIVAPGHRKFEASSLTTTTDVMLNPASSGRVTVPTELIHLLKRASTSSWLAPGSIWVLVTPLSSTVTLPAAGLIWTPTDL